MREKGGFGSQVLVPEATMAFTAKDQAEDYVRRLRRNRIMADDCNIRLFVRTVRGGGTHATVWMVVVRKKPVKPPSGENPRDAATATGMYDPEG